MSESRVAIMINSLIGGGAERVALTLLSQLRDRGIDPILICIEREQTYSVPEGLQVLYLTRFDKLTNPLLKVVWVFISAYNLARIIRRHNIVWIQSHLIRSNLVNNAAKLFGAKHKAQIVSHLPMNSREGPGVTKWLKRRLYRWLYPKSEEIISISQQMKDQIDSDLALQQTAIRHLVIHNPHDISHIRKLAGEPLPSHLGLKSGRQYIVSAGRLVEHKRVDITINAFATISSRFPDLDLLILGQGPEKDDLIRKAVDLGLSDRVHFLGHLSNPFNILGRSEIFVLSSEMEGLPNILIESLAVGTPVVSSDCLSGPREILSPDSDWKTVLQDQMEIAKYGILVPVGRADILANAFEILMDDTTLRKEFSRVGSKYAFRFDKSNIASKYFAMLGPLLQRVEEKTSDS